MRRIKELLELMLEKQDCFYNGLCQWSSELDLPVRERAMLKEYIEKNRPSMFSSLDAFKHRNSHYYWKCNEIKPRIEWIKKHIKRNS